MPLRHQFRFCNGTTPTIVVTSDIATKNKRIPNGTTAASVSTNSTTRSSSRESQASDKLRVQNLDNICKESILSSSSVDDSSSRLHLPRSEALARWKCELTGLKSMLSSYLPTALQSASVSAQSAKGGVQWALHERMDYYLEYSCPAGWEPQERLSNNFISIQCTPPRPESASSASGSKVPPGPTVHGFSLSSYAYPTRVRDADANCLLNAFLKQFGRTVGNTVCVIGSTATKEKEVTSFNEHSVAKCRELSKQVGGAICELTFRSPQCPVLAHGICRAFYHTSRRLHYVALFAVPEEEYSATEDLVIHAVVSVTEGGGESTSTKWTE